MPKYWREIAIEAQIGAEWCYEMARYARDHGDAKGWALLMEHGAAQSARARWAMAAPDDCP